MPVTACAAEHLVRGYNESCGHELAGVLIGGVAHGFLNIVECLVVVLESCVARRSYGWRDGIVEGAVVAGQGHDGVEEAGVAESEMGDEGREGPCWVEEVELSGLG